MKFLHALFKQIYLVMASACLCPYYSWEAGACLTRGFAIFQRCHGENKLLFVEVLSLIFVVPVHV